MSSTIFPSVFAISSYNIFSLYGSILSNNSAINMSLSFFSISSFSSFIAWFLYVFAISWIVCDTLFNFSAVSLLWFKPLFWKIGKSFSPFPINSSISIWTVFGIASNPIDAINISLKCISSTV